MREENYKAKTKGGNEWLPMFLNYVDHKRCIGCGRCVWQCYNACYEFKEVGGKLKAFPSANASNCFGDCHCHSVCPPQAIVCKPKERREFEFLFNANKNRGWPEEGFSLRSNGEAWRKNFVVKIDAEKCTGCGDCVTICQQMVFDYDKENKKVAVTAPEMCLGDMHCVRVCEYDAIHSKEDVQQDFREVPRKFVNKRTKEKIIELASGRLRRVWRYE